MNRTFVIGVGMTKFDKPGTKEGDYPDWAKEAGDKALADAGIPYERRRAGLRRLLLRRLDLRPAGDLRARPDRDPGRQRQQQLLDRLLGALPGAPGGQGRPRRLRARGRLREDGEGLARDEVHRPHPGARQAHEPMFEVREPEESPFAPQMFGNAGRDHMEKYGSKPEHFAWIGWKNHKHSVNNPYAQFQDEYTLDEIKDARMIHEPLTKLQCSPTSDGAAAVDRRLRAVRRRARPLGPGGRDRRPVDGHRHRARRSTRRRLHHDRRLRHVEGGRPAGLRGGRDQRRRGRRLRAPRLLQRQRADHLRGARLRRGGPRATSWSRPRRRPTAATARSSTRRAA